jgi:Zn-dependent M28 family amino/carboxypeptidase
LTPFVPGANDNATGAAAVLALAERLRAEPLANTTVFLVNTGCEEVGCWGLKDWITRHAKKEAAGASYLVLDNIGGRGSEVNYVVDERILLPVRADAGLVALAERVARENPALGAKPWHYQGLDSELSAATVYGQKALGLLNFDPKTGMPPNFHTAKDDMGNIDPAVLDRSEQFLWAILQAMDGGEAVGGGGRNVLH